MNSNNAVSAPAILITDELYDMWHSTHDGSKEDFLCFLETPSVERDLFLNHLKCVIKPLGSVMSMLYSLQETDNNEI